MSHSECDECKGIIDKFGFCISCGLSALDFKEQEFNRTVLYGAKETGAYESRERKARKSRQYGAHYGYTCALCFETFRSTSRSEADATQLDLESKMRGYEEPGSDLARFNSRSERGAHVKIVHGGYREYWKKVRDKKRMSEVRKLDKLNNDSVVSTLQKGSREK